MKTDFYASVLYDKKGCDSDELSYFQSTYQQSNQWKDDSMKKFYKFTTAFLALIMLLPFGTIHAAAYDDCDVNHDGFVDVSDAVATAR